MHNKLIQNHACLVWPPLRVLCTSHHGNQNSLSGSYWSFKKCVIQMIISTKLSNPMKGPPLSVVHSYWLTMPRCLGTSKDGNDIFHKWLRPRTMHHSPIISLPPTHTKSNNSIQTLDTPNAPRPTATKNIQSDPQGVIQREIGSIGRC
jgi:hypothetical protein